MAKRLKSKTLWPRAEILPLEGDVQRGCMAVLKALNIVHWRVNSRSFDVVGKGGRNRPMTCVSIKGHSDVVALLPVMTTEKHVEDGAEQYGILKIARACFIEFKRQGGTQSPNQIEFQQTVEMAGALYWLISDSEQLLENLREEGVAC